MKKYVCFLSALLLLCACDGVKKPGGGKTDEGTVVEMKEFTAEEKADYLKEFLSEYATQTNVFAEDETGEEGYNEAWLDQFTEPMKKKLQEMYKHDGEGYASEIFRCPTDGDYDEAKMLETLKVTPVEGEDGWMEVQMECADCKNCPTKTYKYRVQVVQEEETLKINDYEEIPAEPAEVPAAE